MSNVLRLPESPWNPAQQPGLGICYRFTVSNGVLGETAPKAAAIDFWPLQCISQRRQDKRGGWRPLKLFPCHYDGMCFAAIAAAIDFWPLRYVSQWQRLFFHIFLCRG